MTWSNYCRFISRRNLPRAIDPDYEAERAFESRLGARAFGYKITNLKE